MMPGMTAYYAEQLERGLQYQDFVVEVLWGVGIATCSYSSRKLQRRFGENKGKIEIKFDRNYATSRNLFIEIAEKSSAECARYVRSGIYRDCVEYVIGNYYEIFRFSTVLLRAIHQQGKCRQLEIGRKTAQGFLLPEERARRVATQVLLPTDDQRRRYGSLEEER